MSKGKANPQNIRDLKLMYETSGFYDGIIDCEDLMPDVRSSRYYHEGDITDIQLRVIPSSWNDIVTVCVQREQVTNTYPDGVYNTRRLTDWSKEYTFAEFKESTFWQMVIDKWGNSYWDTSPMDEHEVFDNDDRWGVNVHIYEHAWDYLHNWCKTGRINAVDFEIDEDGNIELGITSHFGKHERFYSGDIWELQRIIEEHQEMKEQLEKLKEHGVDIDNGTVSIRLWED